MSRSWLASRIFGASLLALAATQSSRAFAQSDTAPQPPTQEGTSSQSTATGPGVATAQSAPPQSSTTSPGPGDDAAIGEILVTARRRTERLVDVPVSITAFDSGALARYGTADFTELGTQVPQVMITHTASGNGAAVTIRGIGSNVTADDSIEQAVSFNVDGVSTSRGRLLQQGLFDLEDVQVLKGPQALFFGKNSPGGVIVVESKGPGDHFEAYAQGGYETTAHEYSTEAAIGGPVTDTLGVRFAIRGSDMTGGYVHDIAQPISAADDPVAYDHAHDIGIPGRAFEWGPGSKQLIGRLTVAFKPSTDFDATLKVLASEYRDNGDSSQNVIFSCPPGATQTVTEDLSGILVTGRPGQLTDPFSTCNRGSRTNSIGALPAAIAAGYTGGLPDGSQFVHNQNLLSSLTADYRIPELTLTSVSSAYLYRNHAVTESDDSVFSLAGGAADSANKSFDEELRAVSSREGFFNYAAGAFYGNDSRYYDTTSVIIRDVDPVNGLSNQATNHESVHGTTKSAFLELRFALAPTVELSGGARYTAEKKDGFLEAVYVEPGLFSALHLSLPQGVPLNGRIDEDNVSPQATLSWHPSGSSTLYAGYRTGYKSGTIVNPALIPSTATDSNIVLKDETIRGEEVGFKFESNDRRFTGDVAAYHYIYKDLQVAAFDITTLTVATRNAGQARVQGVEADGHFQATGELSLRASVGYNAADYTSFANSSCYGGQSVAQGCVDGEQNLQGRPLARAPRTVASAGATYDRPLSADLRIGLSVDDTYTSQFYITPTDSPYALQSSYTSIDATLKLHDMGGIWELAVIGRNLRDTFYATIGTDRTFGPAPGSVQAVAGAPRTVLLQGRYNF